MVCEQNYARKIVKNDFVLASQNVCMTSKEMDWSVV